MNATTLRAMLDATYGPESNGTYQWATATEATLADGSRVDYIAANLWASRGYLIRGHEIKVSLSDFRAELRDPAKAHRAVQSCDEWYIVAPTGLVPHAELPKGWGLMEPARTRLHVIVRSDVGAGAPDRDLWTRLLTKVIAAQNDAVAKARSAGFGDGEALAAERAARDADGLTPDQRETLRRGALWRQWFDDWTPQDWRGDEREYQAVALLIRDLLIGNSRAWGAAQSLIAARRDFVELARAARRASRTLAAIDPKKAKAFAKRPPKAPYYR